MGMDLLLTQMSRVRAWLLMSAKGLAPASILAVPRGYNNNILWNIGHVITDQCNMIYRPSGLPSPLPEHYNAYFDPGTSPADWESEPDIQEILGKAAELTGCLETDYRAGAFNAYTPIDFGDGNRLENFDEALSHCNLHEAMHLGIIMTLRKLVTTDGSVPQ